MEKLEREQRFFIFILMYIKNYGFFFGFRFLFYIFYVHENLREFFSKITLAIR